MSNWLDQFSIDNLVAQGLAPAPQPIVPTPEYMVSAMPIPQVGPDYDMARMFGATPQTPAQQNWHAPQTYTPPQAPGQMPQVDLPSMVEILKKGESAGNYQALNTAKAGNTASGAYQYTDATWNGYGGYAKALLAPKHIQDRRFQEDAVRRYRKYQGDPFKIIAEHYLPAIANDPSKWEQPYRLKSGGTVYPVAQYIREILTRNKRTDLLRAFDDYLTRQQ